MTDIASLEWSECGESFEDILTNPRVNLPQLIKLSSSVISGTGVSLPAGQLVLVQEKRTVTKLIATDENGNDLCLPTQCPYNVKLKLAPGNEKYFDSILDVAKADPLPKFVEVTHVTGLETVSVGDRLKVVIVEKSGSAPSFIHFRSSSGKHIKIDVNQNISFRLAVNDTSDKLLSDLAAKSLELPLIIEFEHNSDVPRTHTDLGIINITKGFTENIVLASAEVNSVEYVFVFPLNAQFKFQVNSKLKLAKDEHYRELCMSFSNIDTAEVMNFLNILDPRVKESIHIVEYNKLLKLFDHNIEEPDEIPEKPLVNNTSLNTSLNTGTEITVSNDLHQDTLQQELIKKDQKELERKAKLDKENQKAELKKQRKEKKEKEKEEKKKKKQAIRSSSAKELVIEKVDEEMYIVPEAHEVHSAKKIHPKSCVIVSDTEDTDSHSQWTIQLKKKINIFRDRTKSTGQRQKKQKLFRKDGIICQSAQEPYTCLNEDSEFSESLYEKLPGDMAYESLDLLKHTQRSLAPSAVSVENSSDSGFDEIDQAKIKAWRDSMVPPPLPGNHPIHNRTPAVNEDLYEVAVDSSCTLVDKNIGSHTAWKQFYSIVEQSSKEISTWNMQDVSNCLQDLKLGKFTSVFNDSMVDGQLLLDLDESVLRDLGLNLFEARKLRKFIFGWRPDIIRPKNYPDLKGFSSDDPSEWSEIDVMNHLKVIEIHDFAEFCYANQVNGDLLKDICVDDSIMSSILTSKDKKIKMVKIKNYVIDKWRPKKAGEGNYVTANLRNATPQKSTSLSFDESQASTLPGHSPQLESLVSVTRKASLGVSKKPVGDAPLVAKMKMQLEEKQNDWQNKKKIEL